VSKLRRVKEKIFGFMPKLTIKPYGHWIYTIFDVLYPYGIRIVIRFTHIKEAIFWLF